MQQLGRRVYGTAGGILAIVALGACAPTSDETSMTGRSISLAEFGGPGPDVTSVRTQANPPLMPVIPDAAEASGQPTDDQDVESLDDMGPAIPSRSTSRAIEPGQLVLVDSLIGQVNGRPIYAVAFFEPIEDELIALSARLDAREFTARATEIVRANLNQVVLNELFLAEAESGLTTEQQQGVFAWMRQIRETMISNLGGGTEAAAQARLLREEGLSLDQYLDETKKRALIAQLLDEKIAPRVIVSWRDVEREYQRRYTQFNPLQQLTLARIRLSTDRDAPAIEHVTGRLADGESFQDVAESLGQWSDGLWQQFELGPNGIADIEIQESVKEHLVGLEVGRTTPPIQLGSSTMWLHVTRIEQPEGRSLYEPDVQRNLARELYVRRSEEERGKYIKSLFESGIYDELNTMTERLVVYAIVQYGQDQ